MEIIQNENTYSPEELAKVKEQISLGLVETPVFKFEGSDTNVESCLNGDCEDCGAIAAVLACRKG